MSRTSRTLLCAAALGLAGSAHAQGAARPISFGVSGGISLPSGAAGDELQSGFNANALVEARQAAGPLGFRAEVGYNRFAFDAGDASYRLISGVANGIFRVGTASGGPVAPYVIAGVGVYNGQISDAQFETDSETKLGINGGVGIDIPLSGIATFIEARYHTIFTEGDRVNFIPITVGIRF